MKRQARMLTALLLAAVLSFGCLLPAAAENPDRRTDAELQESVVTREGEETGTLVENLEQLVLLLTRKDVLSLMKIEDVGVITNEVIFRVVEWMLQNREVTMKILVELGASEADLRSIEKIWDSGLRIKAAILEFEESETGRQIAADAEALENDPAFMETLKAFTNLATEENIEDILEILSTVLNPEPSPKPEGEGGEETTEGWLLQEALARKLDLESFSGEKVSALLRILQDRENFHESLEKLLENEHLWSLLRSVVGGADNPLNDVFRQEWNTLASDEEVRDFCLQTARGCSQALDRLKELNEKAAQAAESQQTTEEAAP